MFTTSGPLKSKDEEKKLTPEEKNYYFNREWKNQYYKDEDYFPSRKSRNNVPNIGNFQKCEQIIIAKHGRPVARLVPTTTGVDRHAIKQVIQRMKQFSQSHTLGGLDWKTLRDEGRR